MYITNGEGDLNQLWGHECMINFVGNTQLIFEINIGVNIGRGEKDLSRL
jgi:hypothetical protein